MEVEIMMIRWVMKDKNRNLTITLIIIRPKIEIITMTPERVHRLKAEI